MLIRTTMFNKPMKPLCFIHVVITSTVKYHKCLIETLNKNYLKNKQIKIDIMKENKLQQKIYAMLKKTLHIFSALCVSLKRTDNTKEKDLCEKEKCGKFEKNIVHMLMTFEQFENANMTFQHLLNDVEDLDEIKKTLVVEMGKLPETNRYDFLRHISTLFLNIYLNGYKYGEKGREKSTNVRRIIYDLIIENNY